VLRSLRALFLGGRWVTKRQLSVIRAGNDEFQSVARLLVSRHITGVLDGAAQA
jgi:hypothetical protein